VSDSPFSYEDCALEVMKRGQEQHGFKKDGVDYISMREGRQHGLSVEINGGYYVIRVHNNVEEVFYLWFDPSGKERSKMDKDNKFGDLNPQLFLK